jgi:hypothetical protein
LGPEDFSSHLAYHAKGMSNVRLVPRASYAVNAEIYHRGRAAVSPNESKLAVTNLFDGVDVYSMADQSRLNSVSVDVKENVSTAVAFLSDNTVVFGGGSGVAYIAEGTPLMVTRILRHGGMSFFLSVGSVLIWWSRRRSCPGPGKVLAIIHVIADACT